MGAISINKDSIDFLKDLSNNNNRDWFNQHKDRYMEAQGDIIAFADSLLVEMNKHDKIETASGKKSVFRIYKDVRFSKDKTPYNTHWSGALKRATKKLRGGYYFRIEPGNSFLAGGFFGPESNDIKRIRQDIDANYKEWGSLLSDQTLVKTFGKMKGQKLGSTPRGYAKDHPAIDILRYKQFLFKYEFTDEEVSSPDFLYKVNDIFKKMRPFFDFMSEILTTDANGIPVID
ncbi:MAG: hypothetical protein JWP37_4491 [Mucilaginibacter sp.]|nr:hypothetical protein [Mucilaginibacter sp.]